VRQRIVDLAREYRIACLAAKCNWLFDQGQIADAQDAWLEMAAEIRARSPEQVARMERAKGLRS